jgi:hypothetical protein
MSFTSFPERIELTIPSGSAPPLRQLGHILEHALQLMQSSRRNVIMSSSEENTKAEQQGFIKDLGKGLIA